jgi:serine O-acetyltransferase
MEADFYGYPLWGLNSSRNVARGIYNCLLKSEYDELNRSIVWLKLRDEEEIRKYDPSFPRDEDIFLSPAFCAVFLYRLSNLCNDWNWSNAFWREQRLLGVDIHPKATIGSCFALDHGVGTVIGETAIVGDHVLCYHGVTLGSANVYENIPRHPIVGNNVVLGSGCKVLGRITVGDHCVIGANSVVLSDVPKGVKVQAGSTWR